MGTNYSDLANNFVPPIEIWTSIVGGLSITVFLLLFSHPPTKLPLVWRRYSASIGGGLVVWFLLLWVNNALPFTGGLEKWLALASGGFVYISAVFCNYYLGNIGGGFRLEMLVNLAEANREVSLDEWMALYGKQQGMYFFLEDRLKATLVPWKLAVWKDDQVILTPLGHFAGQVNCFLAALFSENQGGS